MLPKISMLKDVAAILVARLNIELLAVVALLHAPAIIYWISQNILRAAGLETNDFDHPTVADAE